MRKRAIMPGSVWYSANAASVICGRAPSASATIGDGDADEEIQFHLVLQVLSLCCRY
jgi:hypothetical protein